MYHNALWVSLANGLCATPFWWAYSDYVNDIAFKIVCPPPPKTVTADKTVFLACEESHNAG